MRGRWTLAGAIVSLLLGVESNGVNADSAIMDCWFDVGECIGGVWVIVVWSSRCLGMDGDLDDVSGDGLTCEYQILSYNCMLHVLDWNNA